MTTVTFNNRADDRHDCGTNRSADAGQSPTTLVGQSTSRVAVELATCWRRNANGPLTSHALPLRRLGRLRGEILIRECRYVITDRPESGRFDEPRRTGSGSQLVFWPRALRSSVSHTSFSTATRKLSALTMCSVGLWTDGASTVVCLCPLLLLPNSRLSSALHRCVFNWLCL